MCQVCLSCNLRKKRPPRITVGSKAEERGKAFLRNYYFSLAFCKQHLPLDNRPPPPRTTTHTHFYLPFPHAPASPWLKNVKIKSNSVFPNPTLLPNSPFWTFPWPNTKVPQTAPPSGAEQYLAPFPSEKASSGGDCQTTWFSEYLDKSNFS